MYVENIIRDLKDLIHDIKGMESSVYHDRIDASRSLKNGDEEDFWRKSASIYSEGLVDAQNALQNAEESLRSIQYRLDNLIEQIEYEQLSSKAMEK